MWPVVEKAIDFVLDLQTPRGEILWARHADGTPWSFALLTGSSSMCHSLRCAIALAELLGHERPDWELSAARLAHVIRAHCAGDAPDAFAPKHRWAMDWYYPVLAGVLRDDEAHARLDAPPRHLRRGRPRRALRDRPARGSPRPRPASACWPYLSVGERDHALDLFGWAQGLRDDDGHYWTGIVLPRDGPLPRRRAVHLHRRLRRPGRRRPRRHPRPPACSPTTTPCRRCAEAEDASRLRRLRLTPRPVRLVRSVS